MRPALTSGTVSTVVTADEQDTFTLVSVDVWAWTADEPTRLLTGCTVELAPEGAVLRLPSQLDVGTHLTLRIALPNRVALTRATVDEQRPPDLMKVVFDPIDPYERGRIRTFIDTLG
jgi:hypothetical protein